MDELVYMNSPVDYMKNFPEDHPYMQLFRSQKMCIRDRRRVYFYLPTMYEADPDRRYPVLYMFDGQNVFFDEDATFGKSWGVADYLDYTDTVSYTHL